MIRRHSFKVIKSPLSQTMFSLTQAQKTITKDYSATTCNKENITTNIQNKFSTSSAKKNLKKATINNTLKIYSDLNKSAILSAVKEIKSTNSEIIKKIKEDTAGENSDDKSFEIQMDYINNLQTLIDAVGFVKYSVTNFIKIKNIFIPKKNATPIKSFTLDNSVKNIADLEQFLSNHSDTVKKEVADKFPVEWANFEFITEIDQELNLSGE